MQKSIVIFSKPVIIEKLKFPGTVFSGNCDFLLHFEEPDMRAVITVDKDLCVNCHRCISVCPSKMCNNGSGSYVDVNADLCIGCGNCIEACDHGARKGIDDTDAFFAALKKGEQIIAIVAPAIAASFGGDYLRINGWLKSIGVKAVFDVGFGAELTTKAYVEYLKEKNPKLMIAQPCPVLVSFIEIYRPELIQYLAPTGSPMHDTMAWIREFRPEWKGAKIAAISPCFAKRREFDEIGMGDFNVTFGSLERWFKENNIRLSNYSPVEFDNPPAERGVSYSTPGGLMRTAARFIPHVGEITRKIEGHPGVFDYLAHLSKSIERGDSPVFQLVDCLNCEMGCNGGPATSNRTEHRDKVEGRIERRVKEQALKAGGGKKPVSAGKMNKSLNKYYRADLYARKYVDRSKEFISKFKNISKEEIDIAYQMMRKTSARDMLNCSACGYKSCEQMAVAISLGLNKPENCHHFLHLIMNEMHENHQDEMQSKIKATVDSVSAKVGDTGSRIESLSRIIDSMHQCISDSSAAIEQMVANISSISSVLDKNASSVESLSGASHSGQEGLNRVADFIRQIETASSDLEQTNSVITTIASQTRLLSMNAAIESAHAGEAGKGFAVVSDEIRKLAENSSTQAKEITGMLKNVRSLVDMTSQASGDAQKLFGEVVSLAENVRGQESVIQSAVSEQAEGGSTVLSALDQMKQFMQSLKEHSDGLKKLSEKVIQEISLLADTQ